MFTVYVIYNLKGKIYIGQTNDLTARLARHNNQLPNKNKSYTKKWVVLGACFIKKNIIHDKMP